MMVNITSGQCCFMDGSKRAAVALVSAPGSGNTWVRGLLEKATGVCTGKLFTLWTRLFTACCFALTLGHLSFPNLCT